MQKRRYLTISMVLVVSLLLAGLFSDVSARSMYADAPNMGAAESFSVLGATTVTNSGETTLSGDIGVWAGTAITGLGHINVGGEVHAGDAVAKRAQASAGAAVGSISGQANTGGTLGALDGLTVGPGVYDMGAGSLGGGTFTLSGAGVYLFRTSSSLVSSGSVVMTDGARACDVFWYVASDATINGSFIGTVIASGSVWFGTGARLDGRAIAQTGEVTLLANTITGPSCQAPVPTSTTGPAPTNTAVEPTSGPTSEPTNGPTIAPTNAPTGVPTGQATATRVNQTAEPPTSGTPTVSSGLPDTGGAPLRNEDSPWSLLLIIGSVISLTVGLVIYRRNHWLKQ